MSATDVVPASGGALQGFNHARASLGFARVRGLVVGFNKRSDTTVHGGGGGSNYDGGRVAPVHITSTVVVKQDFFLRRADGVELPVQIHGQDLPMRDGQDVTVVAGGVQDRPETWSYLVVANHTAQSWWIVQPGVDALDGPLGHRPQPVYWKSAALWGAGLLVPVNGAGWLGFVAAFAYLMAKNRAILRSKKSLREHLDRLASAELNGGSP